MLKKSSSKQTPTEAIHAAFSVLPQGLLHLLIRFPCQYRLKSICRTATENLLEQLNDIYKKWKWAISVLLAVTATIKNICTYIRAVRYGQKIYITIFFFFFDFDFNHDFDKQTCFISHLTCFCTSYLSCTSCFALFFILLHILLFFFLPIYIYIYIYALVWCYFYIIFILCTVHWADLIWSTFHFWLYPV